MKVPAKLKQGDLIRVIAPSRSLHVISEENRAYAKERLRSLGLELSFGKNAEECNEFCSSSIVSRTEDLHEAFSDPRVDGILTCLGGYNSNQLLSEIDYHLIAENPKVLCGFSDITALQNAIWACSGLVTYSGPHYSTFAMQQGLEYTVQHFIKCLFNECPFEIDPSDQWSSDGDWYLDQANRTFIRNEGYEIFSEGEADGTIVGGNLGTLVLLKGTPYMPSLEGAILFIEEDAETGGNDVAFDRNLQSLIDLPDFAGVKCIVIGRFEKSSDLPMSKLRKIIAAKPALKDIPVVAGADFGHTTPIFTFPIGGHASLSAKNGDVLLRVTRH